MKLISVSSLLYYVSDIVKTKEFYEAIGFNVEEKNGKILTYLNWFSIEFRLADGPVVGNSGEFVYIKVDSVDELQKRLGLAGMSPEAEAKNVGGGVTELQVKDPDGYRLTFFQKK